MDILKIRTNFMKSAIAKIIKKVIKSKTGSDIWVEINDIEITSDEGNTKFHLDVSGSISADEMKRLLQIIL